MKRPRILTQLAIGLALSAQACATLINGRTEEVAFSSEPAGATVFVDDATVGTTPTTANLARRKEHSVRMEKPGYIAYQMTTGTEPTRWASADALPAMIFPLAVIVMYWDSGAYEIEPTEITARLVAENGAVASAGPASPTNNPTPAPK